MEGSYQLFEVVKRLREYMAGNPQKHEKIQVVFLLAFWQVWHAHRSLEPPKENIRQNKTIFEGYRGITTVQRKAHQLAKENSGFSFIFETESALHGTKDRLIGHSQYTGELALNTPPARWSFFSRLPYSVPAAIGSQDDPSRRRTLGKSGAGQTSTPRFSPVHHPFSNNTVDYGTRDPMECATPPNMIHNAT
ncbi:MAG: hypothetical protein Q9173_002978 [Seirophora scorigena]